MVVYRSGDERFACPRLRSASDDRVVPYSARFVSQRRSCAYKNPKRAFTGPLGPTQNHERRSRLRKDQATVKSNALRMGNEVEGASRVMVTLGCDGYCYKRRAEKPEWLGAAKPSQGLRVVITGSFCSRVRVTVKWHVIPFH